MRRHALTILSRARKRSTDSENQPVALLPPGPRQIPFPSPARRLEDTVTPKDVFREDPDLITVLAPR
jgi:hypothetical protein